jgi:hypothetical protein
MNARFEFDLSNATHRSAIRAMLDVMGGTATETAPVTEPAPVAKAAPKKTTVPKAAPVTEPAPVALYAEAAPVTETAPAESSTVTIEEVRKAVSEITIKRPEQRGALVALLGEFGASNVTTLAKDHYGTFVERLKTI